MSFKEGPFIQACCFCDTVIEDKTGVLSLIRIIDTVTHTAAGPNPPELMPKFNYTMNLVLVTKSGKARGRHELNIIVENPSGLSEQIASSSIHFEGEDKGHNLITNINFGFEYEGLYWFHMHLDDEWWTSVPFRVRYNRVSTGNRLPR